VSKSQRNPSPQTPGGRRKNSTGPEAQGFLSTPSKKRGERSRRKVNQGPAANLKRDVFNERKKRTPFLIAGSKRSLEKSHEEPLAAQKTRGVWNRGNRGGRFYKKTNRFPPAGSHIPRRPQKKSRGKRENHLPRRKAPKARNNGVEKTKYTR